ncbi:hypothetical protein B0J13DRAFT_551056 [Dactylonectria estremocensis]|uniref:Uncharacterized protein n=1 Tax=Dactylonectria estremocensis TaxID=1079267 RepID=A0A9P9F0E3_9HYPO|nr:hypothetical protein B0J13DRAFT_551056 [Dactylonectria estremocensis]
MVAPETRSPSLPSKTKSARQSILQWPQRVRPGRVFSPTDVVLNTISILLVLLIAIYISFLFSFNGRTTKDVPGIASFLRQFSNLSPTAVPILFAYIVGRAIKTFAHWRLHHGERIGKLDLLYGSTTVISTVTTISDYGEFSLLALALVVVWALSPLGAQSALRVLSFRPGREVAFTTVLYFNMSTPFPDTFEGASFGSYSAPIISSFISSISAPNTTKQSSLDSWGNIKVPVLELLPGYKGRTSRDWVSINRIGDGADEITYSSLIGIPVAGVPSSTNSTFTIETSYTNFDCGTLRAVPNVTTAWREMKSDSADCWDNAYSMCMSTMSWGYLATIPFPQGWANASEPRCSDPSPSIREVLYLGWENESNGTYASCSVNTSYVELQVECVGWDCVSTAIRPSLLATNPSPNRTVFDNYCDRKPYTFVYFAYLLNLVSKMQTTRAFDMSMLQGYMYDPNNMLNSTALYSQPGLFNLDTSVFSLRLGQIMNTFWLAMAGSNALYLGHPSNYKALQASVATDEVDLVYFGASNATIFNTVTKVHCNFGWLAPLILSTALMWTAAMVTMVVDLKLRMPKMLMNITTMTRGNPNFGLPPGGGGLPDETRGKIIRNIKVRYGSVEGNDPDDFVVGSCVESGGSVAVARRIPTTAVD